MSFFTNKAFYKFFIPSALGIFLFITPVKSGEYLTVPIALFSDFLLEFIGDYSSHVVFFLVGISGSVTILYRLFNFKFIERNPLLKNLFHIHGFWFLIRILGFIFAFLIYFKVNVPMVTGGNTGGLVMESLMPTLVCVFFLAGLFLPLLLDFGLLDFFGAIMSKIMRPIFNLPGRSAVDCIASWLGDGSIGVLLTSKQYEEGFYSRREASVIATTFSAVSVTFSLVVISEVGLQHMFFPFYLTVIVASVVAALVVPRLPPLSKIPDIYSSTAVVKEIPAIGISPFKQGVEKAIATATTAPTIKMFLKEGAMNIFEMWFNILPVVITMGTLSLILSQYTPVFKILGLPFIPIYKILGIPEAHSASQTVMIGFADMFLPSVIASGIKSEMTRFVVAATSVCQLIYMSEIGSIILSSKIALSFKNLFLIFLERTIVTLPIIALISHFIF